MGRSLLSVGQLKKVIDTAGDELLFSSTGRLRESAQLTALRREPCTGAELNVVGSGGIEATGMGNGDAASQQLVKLMRSRNALSRASFST